jgi:molybdopterin synthase sulfur carrier subunit
MATVRFWAGAQTAAGHAEEIVEAETLGELLAALQIRSDLNRVLAASSLLVDGAAVRPQDADRTLPPGAIVDVLPPFAGG